jgi:hypothetical protein
MEKFNLNDFYEKHFGKIMFAQLLKTEILIAMAELYSAAKLEGYERGKEIEARRFNNFLDVQKRMLLSEKMKSENSNCNQ